MNDATFFTRPAFDWQRRYEALRALFVDRKPPRVVAGKFNYSYGYIRLLKHQFVHGKIDFSEPVTEGQVARRGVTSEVRKKVRQWRERRLSAGEITELLSEEGSELSVRTVQRVLAEEGFPRLPRRTRLKLGLTVKGAEVPEVAEQVDFDALEGRHYDSAAAGVFLFAPFLAQLDIAGVVEKAKLPGSKVIPAISYVLSFLALKLLGNERYAHVGDHAFDGGLALFAGLNSLPKCTAMSTYSYSLDEDHIERLQRAFVEQAVKLGLYEGNVINLDFHTVPHYGEESVLEKHWAGARGKTMKSALTLFAQDAESKLMLYTDADIRRAEADDQVLQFLEFWKQVRRGVEPMLVFDSRFTTYTKLSELNAQKVRFITLRRRGERLLADVDKLSPWTRIHVPHAKRKYPNPLVHESNVKLKGYDGELRQIIVRGNGHEKPAFLITNDTDSPTELVVSNYARRWRIENGLAEAVDFFHLNALSSPILTKVHFDVALTLVADTLYTMLARKLRGFEECNAAKLFRHFVRGKATVSAGKRKLTVTFPRRAHNPILRRVPWDQLPSEIPGLPGTNLVLNFR
ncbi:MAG: transposase [Deltaproteobacteria bacterium]|nr:transposase [Deltaproteobacteria bacterium]